MKFPQRQSHSPGPLLVSPFLLSLRSVIAADTCQPATWTEPGVARRAEATPTRSFKASRSVANVGSVQPGQINCRLWEATYDDVNYYTCTALADKFSITVDEFFMFNPEIDPDCGNIEPYTKYCVAACETPLKWPKQSLSFRKLTDGSHLYSHRASESHRRPLRSVEQ